MPSMLRGELPFQKVGMASPVALTIRLMLDVHQALEDGGLYGFGMAYMIAAFAELSRHH